MRDDFSIKSQIESSPALKSGTKDYDDFWSLGLAGVLNIYGNLTEDDVLKIKNNGPIAQVQFGRKFNVDKQTLRLLNEAIFDSDNFTLLRTTFNGFGAFDNLLFLKHLSNLKSFGFAAFSKIDLTPIRDYVELSDFGLGGCNIPLKPLENYGHITSFGFGEKIKDLEIISSFKNLECLAISSQNLKSLEFILPLKKLKKISFALGGTIALDDLSLSENLEEIDIWRTKKLEMAHLAPLNDVRNLKYLKLRELPRIHDFHWLQNPSLQTLVIEELKGLKTFDSLKSVKNVKTLVIKSRLDKAKILSLGELTNFDSIQIYKWYLDNQFESLARLPNWGKIKEIEAVYLK